MPKITPGMITVELTESEFSTIEYALALGAGVLAPPFIKNAEASCTSMYYKWDYPVDTAQYSGTADG